MDREHLYGGVEGGGTKFVCLVGSDPERILDKRIVATTTPDETLQQVVQFFQPYTSSGRLEAIGVASFGPLDLNPNSPTYGHITSTPKPGWSWIDVLGGLRRGLNVRLAFDMDVNAAALGEYLWGANRGIDPSLYLTIGTGIGGGYIKDGKALTGLLNLEMGHLRIPHNLEADPFPGACPFHADCFEGLAGGPAIQRRFGRRGETLTDDDPFWPVEAGYIAAALVNIILTLSPARIVLGGGVMRRSQLFPLIRRRTVALLNGYVQSPKILEQIDGYLVPAGLGDRSGSLGALALAIQTQQIGSHP